MNITRTTTTYYTDDDGNSWELPVTDPFDNYTIEDSFKVRWNDDGTAEAVYLVSDDDGASSWTREELFQGWDVLLIESRRDLEQMERKLNDCTTCDEPDDKWHDYCKHCEEVIAEVQDECYEHDGGHEVDHKWQNMTRVAIEEGRAFLIEKYEHGLVRYALIGESSAVDRQWDVSGAIGVMVADGDWGDDVDLADAARNTLQTYTDWCNGNMYGIVHVTYQRARLVRHHPIIGEGIPQCSVCGKGVILFDDDTHDCWEPTEDESVWGFIGREHAESGLADHFPTTD